MNVFQLQITLHIKSIYADYFGFVLGAYHRVQNSCMECKQELKAVITVLMSLYQSNHSKVKYKNSQLSHGNL